MADQVGEFEFIRSRLAPLSKGAQGAANLTDDGAVIDLGPGERLAVTSDTVIEGRHFPEGEDPSLVARKALRVNLSDLAAMGARPFGYTCSVVWPQSDFIGKLNGFVEGLKCDQDIFGIRLLGGDTTRADTAWTIAITAFGRLPNASSLRRGRARAGDLLVVTGTIGDSGLGLRQATGKVQLKDPEHRAFVLDRYTLPQPRVGVGCFARAFANASIDISDGLLADARHLAHESQLRVVVDLQSLPLSAASRSWIRDQPDDHAGALELATSGDDYELLLAVPEDRLSRFAAQCSELEIPVTVVGQFDAETSEGPLQALYAGARLDTGRLGFTQF